MPVHRLPILESYTQAVGSLRANPLRASLAGLAMAAAVAATAITVTGLDTLAITARQASARAFGSEAFVIAKVFGTSLNRKALADKLERNPDVTRADLQFLERWTGRSVIASAIVLQQADVTAGPRTYERAAVSGVSSTLPDVREIGLGRGRFFLRQEQQRSVPVAVIGADVAETLFPDRDPLDARIRIGGRAFTVVGVQQRQGSAGGASLDRYVWVPFETFTRVFGTPPSLQILARAADGGEAEHAEDVARGAMRARRQLQPGVEDNFDILTPEAARTFVASVSERAGAAGGPVSAMALLAAIIVVANTTLVSVAQRTREIGVRRAVGASRLQVLLEVLAEATLISVAGAVAGLVVALLTLRVAAEVFDVPLTLTVANAAATVVAAFLSGLLAGWYPARRASRIQVVDALHAE